MENTKHTHTPGLNDMIPYVEETLEDRKPEPLDELIRAMYDWLNRFQLEDHEKRDIEHMIIYAGESKAKADRLREINKDDKPEKLFDVVAVNLTTNKVRLIAVRKTQRNAYAIEEMAVMRRGVEDEFFAVVPANSYSEGEKWEGLEP